MRLRYRHALLGGLLAVVGLLGLALLLRARSTLTDALERLAREELSGELRLLQGELDGRRIADPDSLARALAGRTGHRVTLIDGTGAVVGDSDVPSREIVLLQDHRDRPEVAAALEGEIAFAERPSTSVGRPLIYGAAPVRLEGDTVVLRLATDRDAVLRSLDDLRGRLLTTIAFGLLVAAGAAWLLARAAATPLAALADRARAMAGGDLGSRTPRRSPFVEFVEPAAALDRMADELRARLGELERERDQMQALIDAMGEGVIALTDDARIFRANEAARDLLDLPEPILY
ncbi:MAG TPA: PAS domain-containing protein, partial [Longimicrobiales bacterium]|nr:PAS domain-containing protein [Longimicrobiales bacterium]